VGHGAKLPESADVDFMEELEIFYPDPKERLPCWFGFGEKPPRDGVVFSYNTGERYT
jgi:hypothetical protein